MGDRVKFRPWCIGTIDEGFVDKEVEGEAIKFGFVLHEGVYPPEEGGGVFGIDISDPLTGFRVVGGDNREGALTALDKLVESMGGDEAFACAVASRRTEILNQREETARRRADMQAVLGTGEEAAR